MVLILAYGPVIWEKVGCIMILVTKSHQFYFPKMISDEEAEMEVLDCAIIVDKIKCNNQRLREVFAEFNPLKCRYFLII